jgi:N-acylneuraminate cytidylyltransferase
MPRTIALIPARAGSKGVPDKNVRPLGGRPLLAWTIAACRRSAAIDRVIVSTDSPGYAALAQELGAEAPFLRPAELSGDRSGDREVVMHALEWLAAHGDLPDYVAHMRPTTPFRDPKVVDAAIRIFVEAPDATALRSVHEMPESTYKTFEITPGGVLKRVGLDSTALDAANDPRQQFPTTFHGNGYVDVLSTAFIRKSGLLHGDHVIPFVTPPVVEVDSEDEFARLEYQLTQSAAITLPLFG